MRVVVLGGGLAGTAAAARLAKLGHDVTLVERAGRLGGAIGFVERDGFRWDTGPGSTLLPAVLRDLFRKSGRPLDKELDLVPLAPRRHLFADGTTLDLPTGSRAAQIDAVDGALGPGLGERWADYVQRFAEPWDVLRREYLERPYDAEQVSSEARDLLRERSSLSRLADRAFRDRRLRRLASYQVVLDGHQPRDVPPWAGLTAYLELKFGVWTVPGGFGALADALTARLSQRRVTVVTARALDVVVRDGHAAGVQTSVGSLDADAVVCAVDPRTLPTLAPLVERTLPVIPAPVTHLGLVGDVPQLPQEMVVHGKDATVLLRTTGTAPEGAAAWTAVGRGRLPDDLVSVLARAGVRGIRALVQTRLDVSPREQVETWGGSPYGVLWAGRGTVAQRLGTRTPYAGVYAAGASVAALTGVPFVGLTAAVVAEQIGPA